MKALGDRPGSGSVFERKRPGISWIANGELLEPSENLSNRLAPLEPLERRRPLVSSLTAYYTNLKNALVS